jgi:phage terminase large subunit-like protein
MILLGTDNNFYAADMVRDRLNLTERTTRCIEMHRRWKNAGVNIQQVRWERYGMMADIQALKTEQEKQNYRFDVTEVAGQTSKDDRIKRLIPIFEQHRFYLMESLNVTDWQKFTLDLVRSFIEEEYYPFPTSLHKDMLDSLSRIAEPDLKLVWPLEVKEEPYVAPFHSHAPQTAWMS